MFVYVNFCFDYACGRVSLFIAVFCCCIVLMNVLCMCCLLLVVVIVVLLGSGGDYITKKD